MSIERIGHRAYQFDDAFARRGRNRVKFQTALGGKRAQLFEMVAVGGGIELRGDHESSVFPPAPG